MKRKLRFIWLFLLVLVQLTTQPAKSQPTIRVGYFPYYAGNVTDLPTDVFTHMIYFYAPWQNIHDLQSPGPTDNQLSTFITYCQTNGIKSLISINGNDWDNHVGTDALRKESASLLMNYINHWGFDGIDFDLESLTSESNYLELIRLTRDSIDARFGVGRPLTAYTHHSSDTWVTNCWVPAAQYLTCALVSGYDILGSWNTDYTHAYSPLFGMYGGISASTSIPFYRARSFPMNKFVLAATGTGYRYWGGTNLHMPDNSHQSGGATWPGQIWSGGSQPAMVHDTRYDYNMRGAENGCIMWGYPVHHDTAIGMTAFVSVDNSGSSLDSLFLFDDGKTLARKWRCAIDSSLGGVFVWMAGCQYVPDLSPSNPWPSYSEWADSLGMDTLRPTGSFSVTPDTLPAGGGNVTLTWSSANATSASISPGIGSVPVNGTRVVSVTAATTFTLTLTNTSGSRNYSARVTVATPPPLPDSTNKALGRPASASSIQGAGFQASNGNDGNATTRWGSAYMVDNQWWQVDLQTPSLVDSVFTNWEDAYASQYKISVSLDGQNFADVATVNLSSSGSHGTHITATNARYVRITGIIRALQQWGISLWEVGVYGPLPGGQGRRDVTVQALPPIALVTQPTGNGNHNIEIIRDGFTPPVGSSDPSQQYDTYNGGGPRAFDWVGYQFATQHTFAGVSFQEGMQFSDGGWLTSFGVQVRVNGQWVDVQNLQSTPPYAGANGINYETYELSFTPITGDGIRIAGIPGGSAHYISVAELRVFDDGSSSITPDPVRPRDYVLLQNYPNPFNPTTMISFALSAGADVTIEVYNVLGQEIATLAKGYYTAGRYTVGFSGDNLPNGIYFYSIRAGSFTDMKKMVLLR